MNSNITRSLAQEILDFEKLFIKCSKHKTWGELDDHIFLKMSLFNDNVHAYKDVLKRKMYKCDDSFNSIKFDSKNEQKFVMYVLSKYKIGAYK